MKACIVLTLTLLTGSVFAHKAADLQGLECVHYSNVNDDADMNVTFAATDAEDYAISEVSVLTSVNNDHNWFTIFKGDTQVAWGNKVVSIDSDDTAVSFQINLPLPVQAPKKPNAKLTLKDGRVFDRFYCSSK